MSRRSMTPNRRPDPPRYVAPIRLVVSGVNSRFGQRVCSTLIPMEISVTDARAQLAELVRRAEAGDEIVLTRDGHPVVKLTRVRTRPDRTARRAALEEWRAAGANASPGPDAAHSQDFLYD